MTSARDGYRQRGGDRQRRREVEGRLAALGLARRYPRAVAAGEEDSTGRRLATALHELGPVCWLFGRYLAARVDLLPETDCRELAHLPDRRVPMAPQAVAELLAAELGGAPDELYGAFEAEPLAATVLYQEHRARLPGGGPVVVRLVRPEVEAELAEALELLPVVARTLWPGRGGGDRGQEVVRGFLLALAAAGDLSRQADALSALGQDAATSGLTLAAPRVERALSTSRVLTRERLAGTPLGTFAASAASAPYREEVATRLCQGWLRQACFGQVFPAALTGDEVLLQDDGNIAWLGGPFAALPAAVKETVWEYLTAAAAHDPERASSALLKELAGGPASGGPDPGADGSLGQRFRQLVPFRDGGWGASDDLAGYLFLHWRATAQEGYRPRPHLVPFFTGLVHLARLARRLAPGRDPLRSGVEGARLAAGFGEVTRLLDPEQAQALLGNLLETMLVLPRRLQEVLGLAADGRAHIRLEMVEPPGERRRKNVSAATSAALLAMVAVVLLAHHLAAAGALGPWPERLATVLLAVLGLYLLRRLTGES